MNPLKNNRTLKIILGLPGLIIAIIVGWYLISPLFINVTVDESFPQVDVPVEVTEDFPIAEATEAMAEAMEEIDKIMEEPMPEEEVSMMKILSQGIFYDIAHEGNGLATIYQLADGGRVLRFENFNVLNGPELHVWLVGENPVPNTVGTEPDVYYDLGNLKGNIGDQNYEIPEDLDLGIYNSVVIWCVPFRVPFNAASLDSP